MFDWLFGKKSNKQFVRLRWDAASQSPEMRKHFSGADNLSADASLSGATRQTIASRVRLEVENNSFAAGIVNTLVSHCIGRGVQIQLDLTKQIDTEADADGIRQALDRRESRFRQWAGAVKLDRLLRLCRRARCCDGEVFVLLTQNDNLQNECKLFPVAYESSQVASGTIAPIMTQDGETEYDGIRYDRFGNPVAYSINLNLDASSINGNGQWFAASEVLHFANVQRPGQHRGVSELASSIAVFNDIRRFSASTLAAAEAASEISFCIQTDLTSIDDDGQRIAQAVDPGTFVEGARGGGVALPEGWSISQLNPTNPTTNYCQYLESKIREAARCLCMPLMVALADSSGGNYSSSRADQQIWSRKIDIDRQELTREILNPLFERWQEIDKALHADDYQFDAQPRWTWQPFVSLDPTKDENAAKLRLENGVSTLAIECARLGLDWESVLLQRAREKDLITRLGLNDVEILPSNENGENEK